MAVDIPSGDIVVEARAASAETFHAFGRVLAPGDRLRVGRSGPVLLSIEQVGPGPRRMTHLVRYPLARRILFPLEEVAMLVLVLPPGERLDVPPTAFRAVGGAGLLIEAGVWHHGPVPVAEVGILEVLETSGAADRIDRRALRDLIGVEAARISLPEEGAPTP